ncbi:hypothetical protein H4R23_000963 [Coemansia sp. Cherry 401B]|nr:hypothetical protein H4R23_000963 [Coemansia sp. Cherry 401B]
MTVSSESQSEALTVADLSQFKIHGSEVGYNGFEYILRSGKLVIDKTLVCKAFFDTESKLVRVCAPKCFGKTFNLSTIKTFFNVITRHDMPGKEENYTYRRYDYEPVNQLDPELARAERAKLFESTLLRQRVPAFFDEHLGRYPVIQISLDVLLCRGLVFAVMRAVEFWIKALVASDLKRTQFHQLNALVKLHAKVNKDVYSDYGVWANRTNVPGELFAHLSELITSVYKSRYIILLDCYDRPFEVSEGKPWEKKAHQAYATLLTPMLKNNKQLMKGLLTGHYAFPLDKIGKVDAKDMLTVMPVVNGCRLADSAPPDSAYMLGAMYGLTRPEVAELVKEPPKSDYAEFTLNHFGGYGFGYNDTRYHTVQIIHFLGQFANEEPHDVLKRSLEVPAVDDKVKRFALERRVEMTMLVSRLISSYCHDESSCFIWSSSQVRDSQRNYADDPLRHFVLDPLVYPGAVDVDSPIDIFVSLMLHLGYLTVGANNSLRIPNSNMRDLWERVRLMVTFGTWDQIQQDTAQHQLIDSLFNGDTSVVCDDFESALEQLSSDGSSYSDAACLELACRYIASGLTLSKYAATKNQVNVVYDYQFLLQPQFGKTWAIELLPFGRYIQRLVVLFHFASGESMGAASNADALEQLALDSLNTIVDNGDVQPFAHCDVRLDLGVAFGNDKVVVKQRLWKRVNDNQMDTSEPNESYENLRRNDSESTAEWAQRLCAMDNRGWSDSLGWMTHSTDQE